MESKENEILPQRQYSNIFSSIILQVYPLSLPPYVGTPMKGYAFSFRGVTSRAPAKLPHVSHSISLLEEETELIINQDSHDSVDVVFQVRRNTSRISDSCDITTFMVRDSSTFFRQESSPFTPDSLIVLLESQSHKGNRSHGLRSTSLSFL